MLVHDENINETVVMQTAPHSLTNTIRKEIPFYDTDAIQMVWHGNYIKYLEDGREAFGKQFGLEYLHIFNSGYLAPIVDLHIKYLKTTTLGDSILIKTTYVPTESAKLVFKYAIYRESDMQMVAKAESTQLFLTREGKFELSTPDFLRKWREKVQS